MNTYEIKVQIIETYVLEAEDEDRAKAYVAMYCRKGRSYIPDRYRAAPRMEEMNVTVNKLTEIEG